MKGKNNMSTKPHEQLLIDCPIKEGDTFWVVTFLDLSGEVLGENTSFEDKHTTQLLVVAKDRTVAGEFYSLYGMGLGQYNESHIIINTNQLAKQEWLSMYDGWFGSD